MRYEKNIEERVDKQKERRLVSFVGIEKENRREKIDKEKDQPI